MVIRKDQEEKSKETKEVKPDQENEIPMIPNYLDLILGEVNAIRVLLENREQ